MTSCLPPSPSIPSHLCCLTLLFCSSFQRLCNPQIIPRFTDTPLPPFHLLLTFAQLPLLFLRLLPALSSVPSSLPAHSADHIVQTADTYHAYQIKTFTRFVNNSPLCLLLVSKGEHLCFPSASTFYLRLQSEDTCTCCCCHWRVEFCHSHRPCGHVILISPQIKTKAKTVRTSRVLKLGGHSK